MQGMIRGAVSLLLLAGCTAEGPVAGAGADGAVDVSDPAGAAAGQPSAAWLDAVTGGIAASEYQLQEHADGALGFGNGDQGLRAGFEADGLVRVTPRSSGAPLGAGLDAFELSLKTIGFGRDVAGRSPLTAAFASGSCSADARRDVRGDCLRRAERAGEGLVEWWENRPEGLEQGWTIRDRPTGEGALSIEVAVEGMEVVLAEDGGSAVFVSGGARLEYAGLRAWDAGGRDLRAWLEAREGGFALRVDDAGAGYPVTVDPLLTTEAVRVDGDDEHDQLGYAVASAGDVNGDGFGDVIVGAPYDDRSNGGDSGSVFLFLGSASGLPGGIAGSFADAVIVGDVGARFGTALSRAGDINGDGYGDVVVGTPYSSSNGSSSGAAFLFLGSATGMASGDASLLASAVIHGDAPYDNLAHSVAAAGDLDGDGYADVVVGAYGSDPNGESSGSAFVFLGSASGLAGGTASAAADAILVGEDQYDYFGHSVSGAGDVNGDGFGDLVVGADGVGWGSAFVFLGSSSGLANASASTTAHTAVFECTSCTPPQTKTRTFTVAADRKVRVIESFVE